MNAVKIVFALLVVFVAVWCSRLTGLWDKPGSSFRIASYNSDIVMEVWQIKNEEYSDLYATGLFINQSDNKWIIFCLGFDDFRFPTVAFMKKGNIIIVEKHGTIHGYYDTVNMCYRREGNPEFVQEAQIFGRPPGNWWQSNPTRIKL